MQPNLTISRRAFLASLAATSIAVSAVPAEAETLP